MDKKYNILFLASWYPNKTSPQAGNFIQQHARAVSRHCNVFALHIAPRIQKEKFVIESELNNNVYETIVYYQKVTSKIPGVHQLLKLIIRKKAHKLGFQEVLTNAKNIDLIHLNVCFPAGTFAMYLKRKYKIPYIISENWTALLDSDPTKFSIFLNYYITSINKKADMLCPVSDDLKKALLQVTPNQRFKIIPNVVNTTVFNFKNGKYIENNILHISNLKEEHKNITGILRVIKKLSETRSDFKITIAGNGDFKKFISLADNLKIPSSCIQIEGEKSTEEVADLMSKNNLFLLFSNYENLPCVVAESLVMGLPVVSTDVGGVPEMLNEHNGVLLKPRDEDNLCQLLNEMLNNLNQYDNAKISEQAVKKYSYEQVGKQFFDVYQKILK